MPSTATALTTPVLAAVALSLLGCTPKSSHNEALATKPEAPAEPDDTPTAPEPEPEPEPEPAAPRVRTLAETIADLAVVRDDELLCADGAQCGGDASWANCDWKKPVIEEGDEVTIVTEAGVETLFAVVDRYRVHFAPQGHTANPVTIELGLALRAALPAPTAHLEHRQLDASISGAELTAVRTWLEASAPDVVAPRKLVRVGAIEGEFGGGVDRIVVLRPKSMPMPDELEDDEPIPHDVAVALADGEPRGVLAFGTVTGLEVIEAVDLDGDGAQELVWVSQAPYGDLVTIVSISHVGDDGPAVHELVSCSYNGCDAFVPKQRCGHSFIKWRNGPP